MWIVLLLFSAVSAQTDTLDNDAPGPPGTGEVGIPEPEAGSVAPSRVPSPSRAGPRYSYYAVADFNSDPGRETTLVQSRAYHLQPLGREDAVNQRYFGSIPVRIIPRRKQHVYYVPPSLPTPQTPPERIPRLVLRPTSPLVNPPPTYANRSNHYTYIPPVPKPATLPHAVALRPPLGSYLPPRVHSSLRPASNRPPPGQVPNFVRPPPPPAPPRRLSRPVPIAPVDLTPRLAPGPMVTDTETVLIRKMQVPFAVYQAMMQPPPRIPTRRIPPRWDMDMPSLQAFQPPVQGFQSFQASQSQVPRSSFGQHTGLQDQASPSVPPRVQHRGLLPSQGKEVTDSHSGVVYQQSLPQDSGDEREGGVMLARFLPPDSSKPESRPPVPPNLESNRPPEPTFDLTNTNHPPPPDMSDFNRPSPRQPFDLSVFNRPPPPPPPPDTTGGNLPLPPSTNFHSPPPLATPDFHQPPPLAARPRFEPLSATLSQILHPPSPSAYRNTFPLPPAPQQPKQGRRV